MCTKLNQTEQPLKFQSPPPIFIPINSPKCPFNFQPPRDPQATHETTLMNCLQSGDGQLSSFCSEWEDQAGQKALSSHLTWPFMGFRERLGWVAPSPSCRLREFRRGSLALSQFTSAPHWLSGEVNSRDTLPSWVPTLGVNTSVWKGTQVFLRSFPIFSPSVFYCKPLSHPWC